MMFAKSAKLLPVVRSVQYAAVEKCRRGCTSSLFIPGDKANESFAALQPHVDLDPRFEDKDGLRKNILARGLRLDLDKIQSSWNQLKDVRKYRKLLEKERTENIAKLKCVNDALAVEGLQATVLDLKQKFHSVTKRMWELEKIAVIGGLSLPNDINPQTPTTGKEKIVHTFGSSPTSRDAVSPSHLEIAEKLGLIEFYDSSYYFLINDAAKFEMGISYFFLDSFRDGGFIPMSNSDFGKSNIVEGVGLNPRDATSVFTLEMDADAKDTNARLHLVGGASLVSFCAHFTKSVTVNKSLPLRFVTSGRHYNPDNTKGLKGLFSTWQSSAVETFIAAADGDMAMNEFKVCLEKAISLYESLGYHFRVEYLPPESLRQWESLRASFQMYSCNLGCYIEVGSLSICDDYISKRLLMCKLTTTDKPYDFLHVVSGTLVSIPRLLGCVLEYENDNFKIPTNVMAAVM